MSFFHERNFVFKSFISVTTPTNTSRKNFSFEIGKTCENRRHREKSIKYNDNNNNVGLFSYLNDCMTIF